MLHRRGPLAPTRPSRPVIQQPEDRTDVCGRRERMGVKTAMGQECGSENVLYNKQLVYGNSGRSFILDVDPVVKHGPLWVPMRPR